MQKHLKQHQPPLSPPYGNYVMGALSQDYGIQKRMRSSFAKQFNIRYASSKERCKYHAVPCGFWSRLVSYPELLGVRLGQSYLWWGQLKQWANMYYSSVNPTFLEGVHNSSNQQLTYLTFKLDENRHHRLKCYYISANAHRPLLWESILLKVIPRTKKPFQWSCTWLWFACW